MLGSTFFNIDLCGTFFSKSDVDRVSIEDGKIPYILADDIKIHTN